MKLRNRIASIAISSLLVPTIVPNNNCMFYNICSATEIDDLIKELREYLIASEQQCLNNCPDIPLDYMYDKKDYPYTIHKDNIDRVLLQILKTKELKRLIPGRDIFDSFKKCSQDLLSNIIGKRKLSNDISECDNILKIIEKLCKEDHGQEKFKDLCSEIDELKIHTTGELHVFVERKKALYSQDFLDKLWILENCREFSSRGTLDISEESINLQISKMKNELPRYDTRMKLLTTKYDEYVNKINEYCTEIVNEILKLLELEDMCMKNNDFAKKVVLHPHGYNDVDIVKGTEGMFIKLIGNSLERILNIQFYYNNTEKKLKLAVLTPNKKSTVEHNNLYYY